MPFAIVYETKSIRIVYDVSSVNCCCFACVLFNFFRVLSQRIFVCITHNILPRKTKLRVFVRSFLRLFLFLFCVLRFQCIAI